MTYTKGAKFVVRNDADTDYESQRMQAQSALNFTHSSELSVQQSQISIPTRKVGLAKKLASLKEKIHLRKI